MSNNPRDIVKLLRAIATGTDAQEKKHDVIFLAAADMIENSEQIVRLEARPKGKTEWIMIYPSQLEWVANLGHEVRAIEIGVDDVKSG